MDEKHYFECPYCKKSYELALHLEGRQVTCHQCKRIITIKFDRKEQRTTTPPHTLASFRPDGLEQTEVPLGETYQSASAQSYEQLDQLDHLTSSESHSSSSHELDQIPPDETQYPFGADPTAISYNNLPRPNQESFDPPPLRQKSSDEGALTFTFEDDDEQDEGEETARLHDPAKFAALDPNKRSSTKPMKDSSTQYHFSKRSKLREDPLPDDLEKEFSKSKLSKLELELELETEQDEEDATFTEKPLSEQSVSHTLGKIKIQKEAIEAPVEPSAPLEEDFFDDEPPLSDISAEEELSEGPPFVNTPAEEQPEEQTQLDLSSQAAPVPSQTLSPHISAILQRPNYPMTFASLVFLIFWLFPFVPSVHSKTSLLWPWQFNFSSSSLIADIFVASWLLIALLMIFISLQVRYAKRPLSILALSFLLFLQHPIHQFISKGSFPLLKQMPLASESSFIPLFFWIFWVIMIAASVFAYNRPSDRLSRWLGVIGGVGTLLTLFSKPEGEKQPLINFFFKMSSQSWVLPLLALFLVILSIFSIINLGHHLFPRHDKSEEDYKLSRLIVMFSFISAIIIVVIIPIQEFVQKATLNSSIIEQFKAFGFFYSLLFINVLAFLEILAEQRFQRLKQRSADLPSK